MRTFRGPRHVRLAGVALLVWIVGCTNNPSPSPPPPTPTRPPVALGPVGVTGVGDLAQGRESTDELVLRFSEPGPAAIGAGAGSLQVVLSDAAGRADTISFAGTPSIEAPGSLGARATLSAPNVLTISIADSDPLNVEPITIAGLGIRASQSAALGPINAIIAGCAGSLAGCTAASRLASPGTVVAAP